ncbi:MAG TPA: DUF2071 domain-containing protein [Acidobacteriaceae bacterium]|nr:DUF2071 domain-containing protein [Acidobacteriaceae bacterium]
MTQRWRDLLFAHWPIPSQQLAPLLPNGLELDTFDQSAWIGVVPFWMDRVKLRGIPRIPGTSRFPELNLRTYVRERNTNRAGVYFFCLEAANPLAVAMARMAFHLPYHWARMSVRTRGERKFTYQSERLFSAAPVRFRAHYRGLGQMRMLEQSRPGTIEYFLTERYCLFTSGARGELLRGDIHHEPWPLEAAEAEIELNDLPGAYGIHLPDTPPLLYYSRELAVYIWSLEKASLSPLKALEAVGARPAEI